MLDLFFDDLTGSKLFALITRRPLFRNIFRSKIHVASFERFKGNAAIFVIIKNNMFKIITTTVYR